MKVVAIFLLIYFFIKSIFYAKYELNDKKNKSGGMIIIFLAFLGLTLPLLLLIMLY